MTDQPTTSLPDSVLSHDMWLLQLNIEATVRTTKEHAPAVVGYHANVIAATWAAHRTFRLLVDLDPAQAAALVEDLEEEMGDDFHLDRAGELAAQAGIDVGELVDRIRAEYPTAASTEES